MVVGVGVFFIGNTLFPPKSNFPADRGPHTLVLSAVAFVAGGLAGLLVYALNRVGESPASPKPPGSWYYSADGAILGPHSLDELWKLIADGRLQRSHQVRLGDKGTWREAGQTKQLVPLFSNPDGSPEKPTTQGVLLPLVGDVERVENKEAAVAIPVATPISGAAPPISDTAPMPVRVETPRSGGSGAPMIGGFAGAATGIGALLVSVTTVLPMVSKSGAESGDKMVPLAILTLISCAIGSSVAGIIYPSPLFGRRDNQRIGSFKFRFIVTAAILLFLVTVIIVEEENYQYLRNNPWSSSESKRDNPMIAGAIVSTIWLLCTLTYCAAVAGTESTQPAKAASK